MSSKMSITITTLSVLGLLLMVSLTQAARPEPAVPKETHPQQRQEQLGLEEEQSEDKVVDGCGDDECMMRRTLEAHLDYIYTQEKKN